MSLFLFLYFLKTHWPGQSWWSINNGSGDSTARARLMKHILASKHPLTLFYYFWYFYCNICKPQPWSDLIPLSRNKWIVSKSQFSQLSFKRRLFPYAPIPIICWNNTLKRCLERKEIKVSKEIFLKLQRLHFSHDLFDTI